jgi:uncharacterized protein (DUF983 family)
VSGNPPRNKVPLGTAIGRALRLRCPRCGGGRLFRGWFRMHPDCPDCKLHYERAPGYFLGSAYVNYGATALIITAAFMLGRFVFGWKGQEMLVPLSAFCVIFPLLFFRYARALWLAMDLHFDPPEEDHSV